jgi:hypothetical protein
MRVMVIVRANAESEAGRMPSAEVIAQMRAFNAELAQAGVLVGMGGLQPSAHGKRVKVTGGKRMILDGPFTETKELIAGYAIWEVASMDEALAWVARFPDTGEDEEIEIRPFYESGPCGHMAEIARGEKSLAAE